MFLLFNVLTFFFSLAEKITRALQATHNLNEFSTVSLLTDESKGSSYPSLSDSISLSDIEFNYQSRPLPTPILKSISLHIAPGECFALVGSPGAGKSTIAALLPHLYEPSQGKIKIGAQAVNEVDVAWLRGHVGVASQQPNLFDASIAENIRYGVSSTASSYTAMSDTDIRKAAKDANIHLFIMGSTTRTLQYKSWRDF